MNNEPIELSEPTPGAQEPSARARFELTAFSTGVLLREARLMSPDGVLTRVAEPVERRRGFTVSANAKSTPTLSLRRGDQVDLVAHGYWTPWKGRGQNALANADGLPGNDSVGYLEGRIGDGEPFRVGGHLQFTADTSGILTLWMHDDNRTDNAGQLSVSVRLLNR